MPPVVYPDVTSLLLAVHKPAAEHFLIYHPLTVTGPLYTFHCREGFYTVPMDKDRQMEYPQRVAVAVVEDCMEEAVELDKPTHVSVVRSSPVELEPVDHPDVSLEPRDALKSCVKPPRWAKPEVFSHLNIISLVLDKEGMVSSS